MTDAAIEPAALTDTVYSPGRDDTIGTAPLSPTSDASTIPWDATQPVVPLYPENFGIPSHLMEQLQANCNTKTIHVMPYEDFMRLAADVVACTPFKDIQTEVSRRVEAETQRRQTQLFQKEWSFSGNPLVQERSKVAVLSLPIHEDSLYSHWNFIATAEKV